MSQDGIDWLRGDIDPHRGDPRVWDVAVGDEAAVAVGLGGAWASSDGLEWQPVAGDRVDTSRILAVETNREGFIAVGEESVDEDLEARVWRVSPDGGTWQRDRGGDLAGPTYDTLAYVWAFGDSVLAAGTHGDDEAFRECIRLYGGDCGNQWGVDAAYRSVQGDPWQRYYALEGDGGRAPRLGFARGGPVIAKWRDGLVAIGLDGASPLALHASTDGLGWQRSRPPEQLPDLGDVFIITFFVEGDLAIVSGTIEPIDDLSVQDFFLRVGTITP